MTFDDLWRPLTSDYHYISVTAPVFTSHQPSLLQVSNVHVQQFGCVLFMIWTFFFLFFFFTHSTVTSQTMWPICLTCWMWSSPCSSLWRWYLKSWRLKWRWADSKICIDIVTFDTERAVLCLLLLLRVISETPGTSSTSSSSLEVSWMSCWVKSMWVLCPLLFTFMLALN